MKCLKAYIITGIIFVSILGTLFHFAYNISGNNVIVGMFTPINESIWEHTKLLFFPMLIYSFYLQKKIGTEYPCISTTMTLGALTGVAMIIALYYTYTGIIGFDVSVVDILIFYISVIISFFVVYKEALSCKTGKYSVVFDFLRLFMIVLYIIFTFSPQQIPLFINPATM